MKCDVWPRPQVRPHFFFLPEVLARTPPHRDNTGGIWNCSFSLKMHQMLSVHTTSINATTTSHRFWFCVWGKLDQGSHMITDKLSFSKSCVFKMFSVQPKTKSRRRFTMRPVWRIFSKSFLFHEFLQRIVNETLVLFPVVIFIENHVVS